MRSGKKFSKFLTTTLMLFVCLSLVLIVGVFYGTLTRAMTMVFYQKLRNVETETSMLIQRRLDVCKSIIREICLNDSIREGLVNGAGEVSLEFIKQHNPGGGVVFLVHDIKRDRFFPEIPSQYALIGPYLIEIEKNSIDEEINFKDFGENIILSVSSSPITYREERIGTAFYLFDLSQDNMFWEVVKGMSPPYSRLLLQNRDRVIDLRTKEIISKAENDLEIISEASINNFEIDLVKEGSLMPLSRFSGIFGVASASSLYEDKRSLIFTFGYLTAAVLLLTLLVSFFIARKVSKPLEKIGSQALNIAREPRDHFLSEDVTGYIEFQKLAKAFNQVLLSLLNAQEELKRETRRQLEASEERYRQTVEAAPDAITITRLEDGCFLQVNEAFLKMTGYTVEETLGKTPLELNLFANPEDRKQMTTILKEENEINGMEVKYRLKDGNITDTLLSARRISFEGEDCIVSVTTEYTERKKAEEKIRRSRETLQTILGSMPFGVVIIGEDRSIRKVNPAALALMGYGSEEEILNKNCHGILCPIEKEKCPIFDLGGAAYKGEGAIIAIDRKPVPVMKSVIPVFLETEKVLIEAFFDLTEFKKAEEDKKRLESALQRAMKMEAIGTLAGGVAHDLNNILSGLINYPELLLLDIQDDSPLKKPLLTIQKSGERAAAIVQDLLTLARRGVAVTEVINLNDIIQDYLKSPEYEKLTSYHPLVQVDMDLSEDLLYVMGSNIHLSKTIMNLVSNAAEAMPKGGIIKIQTKNSYIDVPIADYDHIEEGDYVILTVSDTGIGISPEDKERIFEPFYTKKKMGQSGTGLGMAVVWGTVKDHNGYIDVLSHVGNGTSFKLYFPATREEPAIKGHEKSIDNYLGKGESILVIDDIEEQRDIVLIMLKKLGYSVASVSSGEEAIEYIRDNPVDLLLLDMIMAPGIDGLETYRRILELYPKQKAVIASGFSENDRVREAQRLGAGAYIKKPYLIEKLGLTVRQALDR